ncbi:hypothetical protein C7960_1415 [Methanohalophilus euhalobius]|jgi:hypothetical protein|uniref:Uncharacterized protein n=1 Tax=Methanohalophilus euhalobius TaxID=51203 RepID=A0A285FC28_9EURY|nr:MULTISPECIES: hypothetical protein [Methanohalophilus]RSD33674.1 MAG: hypothetical protein CI953_1399 [Methanohalophilus sp.]ODV50126.1 MAG: hypothetical protein A8273_785 [Methanohalophilus sp. 2-GBenrich]RXG33345.1 hypothetical protein CI957_1998 [Methanohalophilus sp. WG1-DM]TCL12189.1 hypothetical protein C7960_1415 [Methanohalophilus euhalobius]SNY07896.1 hypothetical protein SAMN06295989_103221 [Methanohalophilus euhalobius]
MNTKRKVIGGAAILFFVIAIAYFFLAIEHPETGIDDPGAVIDSPRAGLYVSAKPVQEEPSNFVEFTQEELKNYPYIHKAVSSPGNMIKVPYKNEEVMDNLDEFDLILYNNDTEFMKVGDNYYHYSFEWADTLEVEKK